jgi:outer membrane protein assembly factor BamB
VCVDAASGREIWSEKAGDSILAAPAVSGGRVFFGTFDGKVIALDGGTGARRWTHDAKAAVVSTPALADGKVIVGTRGYDLLALEAETGRPAWRRYLWFSWVESSASVRDGFAYVGSSDAAAVYAFEASTGRLAWKQDVLGWAWGQPALGDTRVYVGTSSQVGYPSGHRAFVLAIDRASGRIVWRLPAEVPAAGAFGFPGSPALGTSCVFVGGLDGRVHALAP